MVRRDSLSCLLCVGMSYAERGRSRLYVLPPIPIPRDYMLQCIGRFARRGVCMLVCMYEWMDGSSWFVVGGKSEVVRYGFLRMGIYEDPSFLTTLRENLTRMTIQKKTSYTTHLRRHLELPVSHESKAKEVLNFTPSFE